MRKSNPLINYSYEERIKARSYIDEEGCWIWTAYVSPQGYGKMSYQGVSTYSHRASWAVFNNKKIPKGKHVLHSCDKALCVNPDHLSLGSHKENMEGKKGKPNFNNRKSHCPRGHELIEENLNQSQLSKGKRRCRLCQNFLRRKEYAATPKSLSDFDRFSDKYDIDEKGCWIWNRPLKWNTGAGQMSVQGKIVSSYRASWTLHNGDIPYGKHVLHKCDVPSCVNPDHLFLGTHEDNMKDMKIKNRSRNSYSNLPSRKNKCLACEKETHNIKFCSRNCQSNYKEVRIPNKCLKCEKDTRNDKFCSHSCSAKYNNPIRRR